MIFIPFISDFEAKTQKEIAIQQGWSGVELWKHDKENDVYGDGFYLRVECPITGQEYIMDRTGDVTEI